MSVFQKHTAGSAVGLGLHPPQTTSATLTGEGALSLFAKLVVAATFCLIFLGGLVTSHQAGMAVPDWPLSFGSLNPNGWWDQLHVRLEHGHRLFAMTVGMLTGVLCAWVWQSWRALVLAVLTSAVLPPVAAMLGTPSLIIMHLAIWPAAIVFVLTVLLRAQSQQLQQSPTVRALALVAFVCVCIQATLGGLRVTQETAGAFDTALALRIAHGVFGQTFLCVNVALAALLSPRWAQPFSPNIARGARAVRTWAWIGFAAVYLQLLVGAIMRHLGAGLAIPTFPQAAANGSWMPASHNVFVDTNFTHTRMGAIVVTVLLLGAGFAALRRTRGEDRLTAPALFVVLLVLTQVCLGMFVIWYTKPQTLTTLHVLNGAAILATTLLLALRSSRAARDAAVLNNSNSL